jgi:ArsR family transcriptional regulator
MSESDLDKRLARLVSSSVCPAEDASKYAVELRQIADEVASVKTVHELSKVFKALADETRLRILKLLEVREMCVCEVMIALGLTQPTASHHLGILNNVGLVKGRKEGKWVFYSVTKPGIVRRVFDSLGLYK